MNMTPSHLSPTRWNLRLTRMGALFTLGTVLLAQQPCGATIDGLSISTSVSSPTARVGESVVVIGSLFGLGGSPFDPWWPFGMDDPWCHYPMVVDVRFVTHHGSGSITTTNLLLAPEPLTFWMGVHAQTTVTVQPGDPIYLLGEFVAIIDYDGTGSTLLRNSYPWQIQVPDGVPLRLEIAASSDGGVQVHWPAVYRDWRLESADGPGLPWAPVEGPMVVENSRCTKHLPTSAGASSHRLFRLSR